MQASHGKVTNSLHDAWILMMLKKLNLLPTYENNLNEFEVNMVSWNACLFTILKNPKCDQKKISIFPHTCVLVLKPKCDRIDFSSHVMNIDEFKYL